MNKRMFASALKRLYVGHKAAMKIDVARIPTQLSQTEAADMVRFIVRCRGPVLMALVEHGQTDRSWLAACAYMYETMGRGGYLFLHTSEHHIRKD